MGGMSRDVFDGLVQLAEIDESERYEIDTTDICYDPDTKEFVLLTASGCSCWDGEYEEQRFGTFKALEDSLLGNGDDRRYNPSLKGAEQLLQEAREAIKLHKIKLKR
jgi:hypothetical protein